MSRDNLHAFKLKIYDINLEKNRKSIMIFKWYSKLLFYSIQRSYEISIIEYTIGKLEPNVT